MKYLFLFVLAATCFEISAQDKFEFKVNSHDFKTISEEKGPVTYTFVFANVSQDSVGVANVKTSCGCTSPGWSSNMIAPGDSGYVDVTYNPRNRPGVFNKTIRVLNSAGESYTLYIKGSVLPRPKSIEDELPIVFGNLRSKYRAFNLGKFTTEATVTRSFEVYNESDTAIAFLGVRDTLDYLKFEFKPKKLLPKEKGMIVISYNPTIDPELGFNSIPVELVTTDAKHPIKKYMVLSTIEEFFPEMTEEELKKTGRLSFSETVIDFGSVSEGELATESVELINSGLSTLEIRKVDSNCNCVKATIDSNSIEAGGSEILKLVFSSDGRKGRQYKTVTVFSNDPTAPTQVLSVKAEVR